MCAVVTPMRRQATHSGLVASQTALLWRRLSNLCLSYFDRISIFMAFALDLQPDDSSGWRTYVLVFVS